MEPLRLSPQQYAGNRNFQRLLRCAVAVMLRPKVTWTDPSLKQSLRGKSAIFVCNHTHHFDGIFAGAIFDRYMPYALIKKSWYEKDGLGKLIRLTRSIPIDLEDETDVSWYQISEQILREGGSMLIFPEGGVAREGKMLEFKPGAALLSAKTGAPLIPAAIYGDYSFLPWKRQRIWIGNAIAGECPETVRFSRYAKVQIQKAEQEIKRLYGALEGVYGILPVYSKDNSLPSRSTKK